MRTLGLGHCSRQVIRRVERECEAMRMLAFDWCTLTARQNLMLELVKRSSDDIVISNSDHVIIGVVTTILDDTILPFACGRLIQRVPRGDQKGHLVSLSSMLEW